MKVIVAFANMRVIVPCKDEDLTVAGLINSAISRYKKASQKDSSDQVRVHCLKTVEENAILDIDDLVMDVCSDKDMFDKFYDKNILNEILLYEDRMREEKIPEIFCFHPVSKNKQFSVLVSPVKIAHEWGSLIAVYDETSRKTSIPHHQELTELDNNNISSPIKSTDDFTSHYNISTLSDNDSGVAADSYGISSNPPSTHASLNSSSRPPRGIQRKFPQNKNSSFRSSVSSNSPNSSPELSRHQGLKAPVFSRDNNRKSLSSNHPMLYSWIDQQQNIGTPGYYADNNDTDENESEKSFGQEEITLDQRSIQSINIKPYTTADKKEVGLVVHNVVEGSYMDRVGELQMADLITEINGVTLINLTNEQAMNIYENAIKKDIIRLKRTRSHTFLKDQIKIPTMDKLPKPEVPEDLLRTKEAPRPVPAIQVAQPQEAAIEAPSAEKEKESFIIGNKHVFFVNLTKGSDGLGFTVTSKDVLTSQTRDFFIKSILNKGAAIKDGRIKAGDQLLKINSVPIHDKSQTEVVKMLRAAQGMIVLQLARPKSEMDSTSTGDAVPGDESSPKADPLPEQPEEILKLTISLSRQGSAGLGISVKGRHNEETEEDQGIYVKSVLKGGAAAKDGRLKVNDQLLCINDTSLIGLSNSDAMSVLRASMEKSLQKGSILVIIGRSSKSLSGFVSRGASPLRGQIPPRAHNPIERKGSNPERRYESPTLSERDIPKIVSNNDADDRFNELYLKKTPSYNIVRNKSYFRAVAPRPNSDSDHENNSGNSSPRTVSVSSQDFPEIQKSLYFDSNTAKPPRSDSLRSNKVLPPSYEEAIQRKNSTASSHSGNSVRKDTLSDLPKFQILPDKMSNIPQEDYHRRTKSNIENRSSSYDELNTLGELTRTESAVSQSSLDSMFVGPNKIPFSRDGFGRSSMSERKGRAHIDATKSNFYLRLKKYKSMEELRGRSIDDDDADLIDPDELKRSESVDTIISRMDEEEESKLSLSFQRGTKYSSSTPWFTHASEETKAGKRASVKKKSKTLPKPSNKPDDKNTKRRPSKQKKPRPYSCIVDDGRMRNSFLMNESFKAALDQKAKIDLRALKSDEERKKNKGLFKGIQTLLRRNKKVKDEQQRSQSPEYMLSDDRDHNGRPYSMNVELASKDSDSLSERFFQRDKLQKELVQAKMNEIDRSKKELKKRKSDPALHQIVNQPYGNYTSWEIHDPSNVREKSKKMFEHSTSDNIRGSNRHIELRRQSSLPPRNKKENSEFQRVLPRAPSPSNEKPAEIEKDTARKLSRDTNSAPNSKPGTPNRKTAKSPFDSLPRKLKNKEKVEHEEKGYPTLTDLTRTGSVSITHQAQI